MCVVPARTPRAVVAMVLGMKTWLRTLVMNTSVVVMHILVLVLNAMILVVKTMVQPLHARWHHLYSR